MKTAVEFLIDEIIKLTGVNIQMDEPIIEQAKQMEKEQIVNAYVKGQSDCEMFTMVSEAEQYYNETFKSETIVTEYRDGSIKIETYKQNDK
jgi:hypothetical protein